MDDDKKNVTPIRPETDPSWLKTANQLRDDVEADTGTPTALDETIKSYDPVIDKVVKRVREILPDDRVYTDIPGLEESAELAKTAHPARGLTVREALERARDGQNVPLLNVFPGEEPEPRPAKTRALTAIERAEQEAEAERRQIALDRELGDLRFEAEQNAKRVHPMSADTRPIQWAVLLGVALIGAAAFAISYGAVYEIAGWTGWDQWQMILTPLLLDAGIIVFTFLSFIRMERGTSALATFLLAEALTLLSSAAQVIHTLSTSPREGVELWVACAISALPPLILSASSYLAGRTIFRRPKPQGSGS